MDKVLRRDIVEGELNDLNGDQHVQQYDLHFGQLARFKDLAAILYCIPSHDHEEDCIQDQHGNSIPKDDLFIFGWSASKVHQVVTAKERCLNAGLMRWIRMR